MNRNLLRQGMSNAGRALALSLAPNAGLTWPEVVVIL
jgi:hypothetical protein